MAIYPGDNMLERLRAGLAERDSSSAAVGGEQTGTCIWRDIKDGRVTQGLPCTVGGCSIRSMGLDVTPVGKCPNQPELTGPNS